jgi:hypothetical protein
MIPSMLRRGGYRPEQIAPVLDHIRSAGAYLGQPVI